MLSLFIYRRRRAVLLVALVLAAAAGVWGTGVFAAMGSGGYSAAGTEAVRATELLTREFGHDGVDAIAVYRHETLTVDDPGFAGKVTATLDALPADRVGAVTSRWTPGLTRDVRDALVSADRHATYVTLTMAGDTEQERLAAYEAVLGDLHIPGLSTAMGGGLASLNQLQTLAAEDLVSAELVAMPVLLLLLVIIFRGVVAGGLPVLLGGLAVVGSMALMRALTYVTDISVFAFNIATILGLGLAIDYGLFMVSRFRDELARRGDGADDPDGRAAVAPALAATLATAGRTVAFSGLTVVIAFCGLLLFPQPAFRSIGVGGITVVIFDIVAALVVLPALLAVLGRRINALALPRPRRTARRQGEGEGGGWARLATAIMRRPVRWLVAAGAVLLVMGAPLLSLQPGLTDHRYLPPDAEGQVSLETIRERFPAGGPASPSIDVAVVGDTAPGALDGYLRRLGGLPGAGEVELRRVRDGLAHVAVGYTGAPDDERNSRLVRDIRAEEPPAGAREVLVGGNGSPALNLDNIESMAAAAPAALLFVVVATLVLLFLAFGSIVLPVKAVLAAFVSLGATVGAVVWAFQEGGLAPVLGFGTVGTVDVGTLAMVLVIVFGLANDYELFLLSRVREEYLRTGDNGRSVAVGLQRTGHIITSAALLLIIVLATMGFTARSQVLMTIGVGLTVAILVDATLVRAVLVPATMRLLGGANWWLPGPLRRLHDRIGLSHEPAPPPLPPRRPAAVPHGSPGDHR
ncbi:putative membrane protein [Microtetraspora sp. NBRC 13810]|uniref:MMPL family transporter n=1 Tax=Microtetraspora sp. NBRC 13810 TaxID=3030990 RepID=UPI0024A13A58|nr:MMPL family transporter [Microtetraspora sp. NBRC 13810]GLW11703.1 putative membrane protein [Microtetraspora sp. NBRC 13810]